MRFADIGSRGILGGVATQADDSVCLVHIADDSLRDALAADVTERTCAFCGRTAMKGAPFAVPTDNLVELVVAAIGRHYGTADDEGAPWDSEDGYMIPTYDIQEVVGDICSGAFDDDYADDLCAAVVRTVGWDSDWVEGGPLNRDAVEYGWDTFVTTVRTVTRFVVAPPGFAGRRLPGRAAGRDRRGDAPRQLGAFLELLLTYVDGDNGLVVELPAGTSFYRGRLMAEPRSLDPTVENLQSAPANRASANRMSPAGISMFYAAADSKTAIAEIANHGPEPYALVGKFRSTRPLMVLDLTVPSTRPSVFDEKRHTELAMARFRRSFVDAITAPIIPDGRQHIEYTPTQVITEYLRWAPEKTIDGIALPSAQSETKAKTYVLFFSANDCADKDQEEADRKKRSEIPSHLRMEIDDIPTLLLDKKDIQVWQIQRHYEATKYVSRFM